MIKISKEQFKEYIENDCVINLTYKDEEYEIYKMYSYDDLGEKYFEGLFVNNDIVKNIDSVIKKFKIKDEIEVDAIDNYDNFDSFLRNNDLKNINMSSLLDKYCNVDTFSLTKFITEEKFKIEELDKAYDNMVKINKEKLEELYNTNKIKVPFETLYNDIKKECCNFRKDYEKEHSEHFENSLICEHVGEDTKYYKPYQFFYCFYQTLGFEIDLKEDQINYVGDNDILEKLPENLKNNLIKSNLVYSYGSESNLQLELYFKLNDETKEYLRQFENDFELKELENLAFYKNDEPIFVSITQDKLHQDLR